MTIGHRHERDATVPLTRHARRELRAKIRRLREQVIPQLRAQRQDPDYDGSLDHDHYRASHQLGQLTALLARAVPAEILPDDPRRVELGEAVTIALDDGTLERYVVVHPAEATLGGMRTSAASPLGKALLGRRVGEHVDVDSPAGAYRCLIVSTERQSPQRVGGGT